MCLVLVCLGRVMKQSSTVIQSFFDSKDQFGIDFLPCVGVQKCLGAELGHTDIPMPEYYRSDENAWTWSSLIFYTQPFFSGIYYIKSPLSLFSNESTYVLYLN